MTAAVGPDRAVIAIDVGGTVTKCAVIDTAGAVRHQERHPTRAERGPEAVIAGILATGEALAEKARAEGLTPVAAGIAVPGVIDEVNGVATWSSNLGLRDVPLRDLLRDRVGLPTALGHDVRSGGLAEARLGAARGCRHVLMVPVGTGIAAAHIVGGKPFPGAHGAAGEIGHVVVRPGGPQCRCGQRGCLEAVASAAAIARDYTTLTGRPATAADVAARAAAGDPAARRIWAHAVDALADGLLICVTLFDPEVLVIGGGLARSGEQLLAPLDEALAGKLTFQRRPSVVRAALGDEAGCLGAALLALSLVVSPG